MKKLMIAAAIVFMALNVNAKNLILVEFKTQDYDSTLLLLSELEYQGATARHIFAPNMAILDAHGLPSNFLQGDPVKYQVYTYEKLQNKNAFGNESVKETFLHLTAPQEKQIIAKSREDSLLFIGCVQWEDLSGQKNKIPTQKLTSTINRLNGQYLIGYIAVGIYLMESNGSQEDWWPAAEQQTFNEIVDYFYRGGPAPICCHTLP